MPIITVFVTAYNLRDFIANCLNDLLAQTFTDFEIVVADDCSTDNTGEIINKYASRHPAYIRAEFLPENMGSSAAVRNFGLDSGLITGDFVLFADGDDRFEPGLLESLYSTAILDDADISICAYNRVEQKTGRVLCEEMRGFPKTFDFTSNIELAAFINGSLWNKLIKMSLIRELRIPLLTVGEDLCFSQSLYQRRPRIAFVNEILIHYQVHRTSAISNTTPEMADAFANELLKEYKKTSLKEQKYLLELIIFIHIALSMAIRLNNNPTINIKMHLCKITDYFKVNFHLFSQNPYLSFKTLRKYGIRGYAIWICKFLYQIGCFRIFLLFYNAMVKHFHMDVKF
jgi:glycosyltransferase involved in cell wall biosynthesis